MTTPAFAPGCRTVPRPLSVLVVDDHADTAVSTADLCRLFGCAARSAVCAADALALAAADPPDVVLLDLQMPGMDGYELARLLSAVGGAAPLLVAHSGCAAQAERVEAAGFHLHLMKPVAPAVLAGVLRRFQEALVPAARPASASARQPVG